MSEDGALEGGLEHQGRFIDAAQLLNRAESLAARLIGRGVDRLGLLADNGPEWVVADLAAQRSGIPFIPLPAFFTAAQIAHALDSASVDGVLVQAGLEALLPAFEPVEQIDGLRLVCRRVAQHCAPLPPGTSKITFTSGTTGTPRGVCLDSAAQWAVARSIHECTASLGALRHLCLLPLPVLLENVAGVYTALLAGAHCIVEPLSQLGLSGAAGFDPLRSLQAVIQHQAHSVIVLPQMLRAWVEALERGAPKPESLRFVAVGGARVATELLRRAHDLGVPVYEGYGLSECASVVALNTPQAWRSGTVGRPLPHCQVKCDERGELWVAGAHYLGYVGDTTARREEWLATGDMGRIDADGYVHIDGRRKHMIITGFGRNVSPEWVESELTAAGPLAQAVVFGEARAALCAVVVPLQPGVPDEAIERQIQAANAALPDYARVALWLRADQPFCADNGMATGNGRPRREAIWRHYAARFERAYQHLE